MDRPELEAALRRGDARLVGKLLKVLSNIADFPKDERYRTLRTDKPTVRELLALPGAEAQLLRAGFGERRGQAAALCMEEPSAEGVAALRRERARLEGELRRLLPFGLREGARHQDAAGPAARQPVAEARGALVVFDFDGTITVDADPAGHGLDGERGRRLGAMADALQASRACCVLVTAQVPMVTEAYTVPMLVRAGLARLFCQDPGRAGVDHALYRCSQATGGIYNGIEAMSKLALIAKIMAGENRWGLRFAPRQVLFLDDRPENLEGHGDLGIAVLHVSGDGMSFEDMAAAEEFAAACAAHG